MPGVSMIDLLLGDLGVPPLLFRAVSPFQRYYILDW